MQYWESKLNLEASESGELDPGATECELFFLLDQKYAETLKKVKLAYKLFENTVSKKGSSIQDNLKQIDNELQPTIQGGSQKAASKQRNSLTGPITISPISKQIGRSRNDSLRVDTTGFKQAASKVSKLVRMGSKSLPGTSPNRSQKLKTKEEVIIDEKEIRLALESYDKEDTQLLITISKGLIEDYKKFDLPDPNSQIASYYIAKIKPKKKLKSTHNTTKELKEFYTPKLSSGIKPLSKVTSSVVVSTSKSTLLKK